MVRVTKILCILICCSVLLGTTGCAYNSTNPVARYASYGGTYGAIPGIIGLAVAGAAMSDEDDYDENNSADDIGTFSLVLLGAGFLGGTIIGGTIGLFRWMILGDFESGKHDDGLSPELYDGTIKIPPKYRDAEQETGPSPWDVSPNQ